MTYVDTDKTEASYQECLDQLGLYYRVSIDVIKREYELAMAELHGATPEKMEATRKELEWSSNASQDTVVFVENAEGILRKSTEKK